MIATNGDDYSSTIGPRDECKCSGRRGNVYVGPNGRCLTCGKIVWVSISTVKSDVIEPPVAAKPAKARQTCRVCHGTRLDREGKPCWKC